MQNVKSLPPDPVNLLNSMRSMGYTFQTAVADIIDNSITAGADQIKLLHEESADQEPKFAIVDNGCGMTSEELVIALRHACSHPEVRRGKKDLGRFGLGLKTASLSQCRKLTVITKKNQQMSAAEWDLDFIKETRDWSLKVFSPEQIKDIPYSDELKQFTSGTVVLWRGFDKLSSDGSSVNETLSGQLMVTREYLSLVFHRFLSRTGKEWEIALSINGREVEPKDPFAQEEVSSKSTSYPAEKIKFVGEEDANMVVKAYTLPAQRKIQSADLKKTGIFGSDLASGQGFYIYRNKRLICWGSWFGLSKKAQKTKLTRVKIDISNMTDDSWGLDIKKSQAVPPKKSLY